MEVIDINLERNGLFFEKMLHHSFDFVDGNCMEQNSFLNFKADYIEHPFEARAILSSSCDVRVIKVFEGLVDMHQMPSFSSVTDYSS